MIQIKIVNVDMLFLYICIKILLSSSIDKNKRRSIILSIAFTNMCSYYHYCIIFSHSTRSFFLIFFFARPEVVVIDLHSSIFSLRSLRLAHAYTHDDLKKKKDRNIVVLLSFLWRCLFFSHFSYSLNIRIINRHPNR